MESPFEGFFELFPISYTWKTIFALFFKTSEYNWLFPMPSLNVRLKLKLAKLQNGLFHQAYILTN